MAGCTYSRKEPPINTPLRNIRIADELWNPAQATAQARGETVTDAIRRCLTRYIAEGQDQS